MKPRTNLENPMKPSKNWMEIGKNLVKPCETWLNPVENP